VTQLELSNPATSAREHEIQNKIPEAEVHQFDYKLIQENLKKFHDAFSALTDQENWNVYR